MGGAPRGEKWMVSEVLRHSGTPNGAYRKLAQVKLAEVLDMLRDLRTRRKKARAASLNIVDDHLVIVVGKPMVALYTRRGRDAMKCVGRMRGR